LSASECWEGQVHITTSVSLRSSKRADLKTNHSSVLNSGCVQGQQAWGRRTTKQLNRTTGVN
jgi:hypothetical protein